MSEIVDFDSFLELAQASYEPQRLLFVFVKVALPEDATEQERQRYDEGHGGGLMPVMYVDKDPGEISNFSGLIEESRATGEDWYMVLTAALIGDGEPPGEPAVEDACARIINTVHAGGDLSGLLAFDREGDPVVFE